MNKSIYISHLITPRGQLLKTYHTFDEESNI